MAPILISRHEDAMRVLADPRFDVLTAGVEGLAWLRSHVSRFSTGAAHVRRRGYVTSLLSGLVPARLRTRTREVVRPEAVHAVAVTVLAEAATPPGRDLAARRGVPRCGSRRPFRPGADR